jgi:hypothetical protein
MRHVDPRYFADTLGTHLGSGFSVEPVMTQSAWFRPHKRSEDVPSLYVGGAGTHRGAGIPGVLSSGKIAAELIGPADAGGRRRANGRQPDLPHPADLPSPLVPAVDHPPNAAWRTHHVPDHA